MTSNKKDLTIDVAQLMFDLFTKLSTMANQGTHPKSKNDVINLIRAYRVLIRTLDEYKQEVNKISKLLDKLVDIELEEKPK